MDTGVTECFIHSRVVKQLQLQTTLLPKEQIIKNVNGTINKIEKITYRVIFDIKCDGIPKKHIFYITDIGVDDLILGYPFFGAAEPRINWKNEHMDDITILAI